MKLPSFSAITAGVVNIARRFPLPILSALIGVVALWLVIDIQSNHAYTDAKRDMADQWVRVFMVCLLGLSALSGAVLFSESRNWPARFHWGLQGLIVLALCGYGWVLNPGDPLFEDIQLPRYMALLAVAHLWVAVAPYLNNFSVADFWEYNKRLFVNLVIGGFYTLVLFIGISAAILAADNLFDIQFRDTIYPKLFICLAGIFNTVYFLNQVPRRFEFEEGSFTLAFKILCKYIFIPIVILYFLILYAYAGKILISWNLPKGWVSSLVIGFSAAGILTYLLNYRLPAFDDSAIVRLYHRWFWPAVMPLTILLFVGVGRRLADYGVTEPRFLIAHTGIWLSLSCIYFFLTKGNNIKFIPISLMFFILSYAFGPFNAFAVSKDNQTRHLRDLFESSGHFEAGKLKSLEAKVDSATYSMMESKLQYLEYRNALDGVQAWLPLPIDSIQVDKNKYPGKTERILNFLKIESQKPERRAGNQYVNIVPPNNGLSVSGYDQFHEIALYAPEQYDTGVDSSALFTINRQKTHLMRYKLENGRRLLIDSIDVQPYLSKIHQKENADEVVDSSAATFVANQADGRILLFTKNLTYQLHKDTFQLNEWHGWMFIDFK